MIIKEFDTVKYPHAEWWFCGVKCNECGYSFGYSMKKYVRIESFNGSVFVKSGHGKALISHHIVCPNCQSGVGNIDIVASSPSNKDDVMEENGLNLSFTDSICGGCQNYIGCSMDSFKELKNTYNIEVRKGRIYVCECKILKGNAMGSKYRKPKPGVTRENFTLDDLY